VRGKPVKDTKGTGIYKLGVGLFVKRKIQQSNNIQGME